MIRLTLVLSVSTTIKPQKANHNKDSTKCDYNPAKRDVCLFINRKPLKL